MATQILEQTRHGMAKGAPSEDHVARGARTNPSMRPQTPRTGRQTRRRPNLLADLPDDLVVRVLEGLSATNLCYACMSCRRLHQLEAQNQEVLWCALATDRWALEDLQRWPPLGGNDPLSWAQHRRDHPNFTQPWVPRSATDRAGWKHRFAYLRAKKSGTTRDAMSRCLEAEFEFEFVLRSGKRRASTACKLFVFRRVIVVVALQEDYWAKGGLAKGAVPASLELHVRNRADGRRARLFEVPMPTQEQLRTERQADRETRGLSQELGIGNHLEAQCQTHMLPWWSDGPLDMTLTMARDTARESPTRAHPHGSRWEQFSLGWEKDKTIADLFVALHSGVIFGQPPPPPPPCQFDLR